MKILSLSAATLAVVVAALAFAGSASAATPSFKCWSASKPAEHAICDSNYLSKLDRKMAFWYGRALNRAGYFDQVSWLKKQQRQWLWQRNSCRWDESCLASQYNWRIQALRNYAEHV